jgi:outer membrane protein assembly factor BamD (BamD/ComL family)
MFFLISEAAVIGGLVFFVITGCAAKVKIQKQSDEGYAQGYKDAFAKIANENFDSADRQREVMNYRDALAQCRDRLTDCLEAGKDK